MSHSVRQHLQLDIEVYDTSIRSFIPGYEVMLERAAEEIARVKPERILDLGCADEQDIRLIGSESPDVCAQTSDANEQPIERSQLGV